MQRIDINNPTERKKLIWAIGLGLLAIVFLWWTFFGFGGSSKPAISPRAAAVASPTPGRIATGQNQPQKTADQSAGLINLGPVRIEPTLVVAGEPKRNIFAYYEPPPPPPQAAAVPTTSPTPPPPVLLAAVSPANIYARAPEVTLELSGDKFTSSILVIMDGRELPTRYINPQQVSASVPPAMIASPGARQVMVKTPDGRLYSNPVVLNVAPPPTPNYTYIGILGTVRHIDTAIVQDRTNREILNVQRGDVLGGRFRVTSISEKEVMLLDTNLRIKHTLPFTTESDKGYSPQQRPTPKTEGDDDEP